MPGMANFEPGVERYRVTGGAVTAVLMGAGDRLEIIDPEGCQPVEVAAFVRAHAISAFESLADRLRTL